MKEMLKGTCTCFSKHVYQLSVYQVRNALTQNATHYNYQNSYIFEHRSAILRGLYENLIQAQHTSV